MTNGLVHSEGGVLIDHGKGRLGGGVQYGSVLVKKNTKIKIDPAAQQVATGQGAPMAAVIGDYRPGGPAATTAASYTAIDPGLCVGGVWKPERHEVFTGVVYVPCALILSGEKQRSIDATFAAEGSITVRATKLSVGPAVNGPSLISGASGDAVIITGTKFTARGQISAAQGSVRILKASSVLICGAQAQNISAVKSALKIPMLDRCTG